MPISAYEEWVSNLVDLPPTYRLRSILSRNLRGITLKDIRKLMRMPRKQVERLLHRMERDREAHLLYMLDAQEEGAKKKMEDLAAEGCDVCLGIETRKMWIAGPVPPMPKRKAKRKSQAKKKKA